MLFLFGGIAKEVLLYMQHLDHHKKSLFSTLALALGSPNENAQARQFLHQSGVNLDFAIWKRWCNYIGGRRGCKKHSDKNRFKNPEDH